MSTYVLEPAAQEIAEATSKPPFLYELGPDGARQVLDDIQSAPIGKPEVDEKWIIVPAAVGDVRVRLVRPAGASGSLPAILYMHGGGWILGNAGTHDRLVRELAVGATAAVAFVEYARSPEARYNGIIHDFMMLNPLRETAAATAAVEQAIRVLRKAFAPERRGPGPARGR